MLVFIKRQKKDCDIWWDVSKEEMTFSGKEMGLEDAKTFLLMLIRKCQKWEKNNTIFMIMEDWEYFDKYA